ncbi:hypothetical protein F4778DRAFT_752773 [Xylariomycetidae sp. FL2044]|nr:hypothetical protein F4778DRAFT_752773 [Xylariomycetidae sp. FL2044]
MNHAGKKHSWKSPYTVSLPNTACWRVRDPSFCHRMHAAYSPACQCWRKPRALFLVNKSFYSAALEIFYKHNFIRSTTANLSCGLPIGFFTSTTPDCLRILRHLQLMSSGNKLAIDWSCKKDLGGANGRTNLCFLCFSCLWVKIPRYEEIRANRNDIAIEIVREHRPHVFSASSRGRRQPS